MPRPDRIQYQHALYHVTNRGHGRQKIFHSVGYYEDFLATLQESYTRFDAVIHAYCLMGNQYHLLIETPRANLDRIMRHINGVYTQRYNSRKKSEGTLFRGRYKAILIDQSAYLLQLGRYIHRQPAEVRGATDEALEQYRWSSYLSYINRAPVPDWLHCDKTYKTLGQRNRYAGYRKFVSEGNDEETVAFYGKGNIRGIYGDRSFRQSIKAGKENLQTLKGVSGSLSERPSIPVIVDAVAKVFKTDVAAIKLRQKGRLQSNVARQMAIYCSQQLGDHSLKEIADYFSLTNGGSVSPSIQAIKAKIDAGDLAKEYSRLEKRLYKRK